LRNILDVKNIQDTLAMDLHFMYGEQKNMNTPPAERVVSGSPQDGGAGFYSP